MFSRPLDVASGGLFYAALTLLCAVLYLPGLAQLPPVDRDEARFMQATKQMIETGDYAHIRFQADPRDKKPIGAYWAQAASVNVMGQTLTEPWPYRIPSVLGVWLAVMVTAWAVGGAVSGTAGFAAGAILATTLLTTVEAHLAKADALLLAMSAIVFAGLLRAATAQTVKPVLRYAFWIALGVGVLIKGPILPVVLVLALTALFIADKNLPLNALQPVVGVPLALLVMLAWPIVTGLDEAIRAAQTAFLQDLWPKLTGGQESHGAWPGAHLLMSLGTLWPWSLALPLAALAAWRERASPIVRVCTAWIVPFWLVLELIPTKLPHYTLPLFPAIAVLIASALSQWRPARVAMTGLAGLGVALGLLLAAVPLFNLPRWDDLNLSTRLAETLARHAPGRPAILVGYGEPSAVFLLGTDTLTTNPEHAASLLAASPGAITAVEESALPALAEFMAGVGKNIVRLDAVSGYNYSRGRPVTLVVVTAAAPP
ncbi:MAG: glycosyltransferase family 39 protein [Rhodospirillaceae bacterium]|nr:glycosyltransferase family 39 protein [Rhodospirillaceae bacterium]